MFKYILCFVVLSPLLGVALVENGLYAPSLGHPGYSNGASVAFFVHCLVLLLFAWLAIDKKLGASKEIKPHVVKVPCFVSLAYIVFTINLIFLFVMLFGAGGLEVIRGRVQKGEFRTSLGAMGALAYWITLYFAPTLLAYLSVVSTKITKSPRKTRLLAANFAICSLIGLNWGFKSTTLALLLPSVLILYWKISFKRALAFGLIAAVVLTMTFMLFDRANEGPGEILTYLAVRATVMQGDVSWGVWDLYRDKQPLPPYLPVLSVAMGDRFFSLISGIERRNFGEWVKYHYDYLLTNLIGYPLDEIEAGQSVTGTIFSEAVIALGSPGFLLFSIFGGLVAGVCYNIIKDAIGDGRFIRAAISSNYFCLPVFSWLNGGGITILFTATVFIGIGTSYWLLRRCENLAGWSGRSVSVGFVARASQPATKG